MFSFICSNIFSLLIGASLKSNIDMWLLAGGGGPSGVAGRLC